MNWKTKARITRCCARVPKSERCYRFIQKHFGRLSDDPQSRLNPTVALVAMLRKHQRVLAGGMSRLARVTCPSFQSDSSWPEREKYGRTTSTGGSIPR